MVKLWRCEICGDPYIGDKPPTNCPFCGAAVHTRISVQTFRWGAVAVAILAVGEITREVGKRFGISGYRRSNLLDVTVCTYPFLFPFFIPTILAASTTAGLEGFGAPRLSAWTIGLHNAHSWALLLVILFAVGTGWGRGAPSSE